MTVRVRVTRDQRTTRCSGEPDETLLIIAGHQDVCVRSGFGSLENPRQTSWALHIESPVPKI